MPHQAWHADADAVLCPADDAVAALRVVLEAEDELGEGLGVHVGQLHRPYFLDHVARRGGEAATFTYLEGGLQRDGDGPAGGITRDIGLVDPCASQIEAGGDLAYILFQGRRRTCLEAIGREALQHDIFNATLLAETTFLLSGAVFVDHEDVGLHPLHRADEVHHTVAIVDESVFHVSDSLHHEETFLFGIERLMVLIVQDGLIGADTDIEVTILRRLSEELNVTAVQEVVAPADENLGHGWELIIDN